MGRISRSLHGGIMRLIDADALKKHYAWWEDDKQKLFDSIVDQQPTVDAVPVIRCKDCKWNTAVEWVHCAMVGGMFGRTTDNYCSRAERKEE